MKIRFALHGLVAGWLLLMPALVAAQTAPGLQLWYAQPAKDWNQALPIGNGRLGAMIFGRTGEELIQLNEQTLWTGGPPDLNPNPAAPDFLQPVREALFADQVPKAVDLLKKMQGPDTQMYQPLGDLILKQKLAGETRNYRRELDVSNAVASITFDVGDMHFSRELFSSAPDQLIVMRLSASQHGALEFDLENQHGLAFTSFVNDAGELVLRGKARIESDERRIPKPIVFTDDAQCRGMRFEWRVKVLESDGERVRGQHSIGLRKASHALLAIAAATSFKDVDTCPDKNGRDETAAVEQALKAVQGRSYEALKARHVADYQHYFNRVSLRLGKDAAPDAPTDERLRRYKAGQADPQLEALYFQFGRYLLISSSRPGGFPANLQGIWNAALQPSWRSNYTTNINLQMNYWPAEATNLSELTEPLMTHIARMAKHGEATAQNYYRMHGWAVHHNSDLWAQTNPVGAGKGDPKWANWSLGSPWLSQHLYEHYRYTSDKGYLRDVAYPLMKGAADFALDWLVEHDGQLVTAPSTSPENVYIHPKGYQGTVTIASAMDMEIIWDLFTNLIEASHVLGIDADYAAKLEAARAKLSPLKIGHKGNLEEWYGDWEDADPQHRHVSHLFGLHPGREISPLIDAKFADAARKTLEVRGDGGTGWSKAWKINFWARLLDGDHAYKMLQELLRTSTLDNLFDTHPPFQIDGNFGATAGVGEMLLQSQLGEVQLLPALPAAWTDGEVKGLIARGAFEVSMRWAKGKLVSVELLSKAGNPVVLRTREKLVLKGKKIDSKAQEAAGQRYYLSKFPTREGQRYSLTAQP